MGYPIIVFVLILVVIALMVAASTLGIVAFVMTFVAKTRRIVVTGAALGLLSAVLAPVCSQWLVTRTPGRIRSMEQGGLGITLLFGIVACLWGMVRLRDMRKRRDRQRMGLPKVTIHL